jgi:aliphatic nitrilase
MGEPHRDDEALIYADLDMSLIPFAKFFADGAGHYARPDVFSFGVDRTPHTPFGESNFAEDGTYTFSETP